MTPLYKSDSNSTLWKVCKLLPCLSDTRQPVRILFSWAELQSSPERYNGTMALRVQYGPQSWVVNPQLTRNAEISVAGQGLFHFFLVHFHRAGPSTGIIDHILQHLFILLDQPTAAVIAQNAKENILVVGEVGHTLDQIDMRMLRSLTRSVFRPTPHDWSIIWLWW